MSLDPVLIAYGVSKYGPDNSKNYWTRIGEAYPHESGNGLTVTLSVLPPDGKIILLERDEADDARLEKRAQELDEQLSRQKMEKGREAP